MRIGILCLLFVFPIIGFVAPCCVNITIGLVIERSQSNHMAFIVNRTIGIIETGMRKAREIVSHSVNLNLIIRNIDIARCTYRKFGALTAELYHSTEIHAIIGPGKIFFITINGQGKLFPPRFRVHPAHPRRLIWVFAVRRMTLWILAYSHSSLQRLWLDCVDAHADLSFRCAHMLSYEMLCSGSLTLRVLGKIYRKCLLEILSE